MSDILGTGYLRLAELSRSGPCAVALAAAALVLAAWYGRNSATGRAGLAWLSPGRRRGASAATPAAAAAAAAPRDDAASLPPAIVLGGDANALSVARDLAAMGVTVYAIGTADSAVRFSRRARWIDVAPDGGCEAAWARYLLGPEAAGLQGAVLLACSDAAMQVLARHGDALRRRFRLDLFDASAHAILLDKQKTYELARAAGVTTPRWWSVSSRADVQAIERELVYPLIVKPRLSHVFDARFGRKFIVVDDYASLLNAYDLASGAGMRMMLVELIPGGDDRLCSYFTYLDEAGTPLFHYTKRIIRRYPGGMGAACYHITDWIPELIAPSNRLLDEAGARGLANIEFKQDPRDGQYKLIECNARFVASNALVSDSGFPLAALVYNRITNRPLPKLEKYRLGMRMIDPFRDFRAFCELRRGGRITPGQWLRSILHRQSFAYFRWSDPMPCLTRLCRPLARALARRGGQH